MVFLPSSNSCSPWQSASKKFSLFSISSSLSREFCKISSRCNQLNTDNFRMGYQDDWRRNISMENSSSSKVIYRLHNTWQGVFKFKNPIIVQDGLVFIILSSLRSIWYLHFLPYKFTSWWIYLSMIKLQI